MNINFLRLRDVFISVFIFVFLGVFLHVKAASANVILPFMMMADNSYWFIIIVVICLEGFLLYVNLDISASRAFFVSTIMNVVSSVVGLLAVSAQFIGLGILSEWLFGGILPIFDISEQTTIFIDAWLPYTMYMFFWAVTVAVELVLSAWLTHKSKKDIFWVVTLVNTVTYIGIILIFFLFSMATLV